MLDLTLKEILVFLGVPVTINSLILFLLKTKFDRVLSKIDEREKAQERNAVLLIKSVNASINLGEATALAIKNGKCNGETEAALEYARQVKREQKDFLTELGVKSLY